MKQKKYAILMFVGIAVMVLMPFEPCRADWEYLYSDGDCTQPYSDEDSGEDPDWEWSYEISNYGYNGDITGSWAAANIEADETVEILASGELDPDNPQPDLWGMSYYVDIFPYTEDGLDLVEWIISASGVVEAYGSLTQHNLGTGDTLYSFAEAGGAALSEVWGAGIAKGQVSEGSLGWAAVDVDGEATEDYQYVEDGEYGRYYAYLEFTVSADDEEEDVEAGAGPNSFTALSELWTVTDAHVSASISEGHSGKAFAEAHLVFGGTADIWVHMPE